MLDSSLKDDDVARIILERFMQSSVVISFAEIARFAKERKRNRLVFQVMHCECYIVDTEFQIVNTNTISFVVFNPKPYAYLT